MNPTIDMTKPIKIELNNTIIASFDSETDAKKYLKRKKESFVTKYYQKFNDEPSDHEFPYKMIVTFNG